MLTNMRDVDMLLLFLTFTDDLNFALDINCYDPKKSKLVLQTITQKYYCIILSKKVC